MLPCYQMQSYRWIFPWVHKSGCGMSKLFETSLSDVFLWGCQVILAAVNRISLSWCTVFISNHCIHVEIFKWVARTWLHERVPGWYIQQCLPGDASHLSIAQKGDVLHHNVFKMGLLGLAWTVIGWEQPHDQTMSLLTKKSTLIMWI